MRDLPPRPRHLPAGLVYLRRRAFPVLTSLPQFKRSVHHPPGEPPTLADRSALHPPAEPRTAPLVPTARPQPRLATAPHRRQASLLQLATVLAVFAMISVTAFLVWGAPSSTDALDGERSPEHPITAAFFSAWPPSAAAGEGANADGGRYGPQEKEALAEQIRSAEQAHLDAVISSWWGSRHYTDDALRHGLAQSMRDSSSPDLRWAIYYEPEWRADPSVEQITSDLEYLADGAFSEAAYLRVDRRPVVFVAADPADDADMAERWAEVRARTGVYVVLKAYPGFQDDQNQPDSWHQYGQAVGYSALLPYSVTVSRSLDASGGEQFANDPARFEADLRKMVESGAHWQLVAGLSWPPNANSQLVSEFGHALETLCRVLPGHRACRPGETATAELTPEPTSSKQVTSLVAAEDTYTNEAEPDLTHGYLAELEASAGPHTKRTLLRFILSSVPADSTIESAVLRLFVKDDSEEAGAVHNVLGDWSEATTTWSNAPGVGGEIAALDGAALTGAWVEADVTSAVVADETVSFYVLNALDEGVDFASSEGGRSAPTLTVRWSYGDLTATATPIVTPTLTGAPTNTPIPTDTPLPATASDTATTPTAHQTPTPTDATTMTETPTRTPTPSETPNPSPKLTETPKPTPNFSPTATAPPEPGDPTFQPEAPIQAAFFYPWFPNAWTQAGIFPYTLYTPSLGFYDSQGDATIDEQLRLAKRANIEAFIASWWGQGHHTDAALQYALGRSERPGSPYPDMRWAVYYELEGYADPSPTEIVADLQYLAANVFSHAGYLDVDGRPVVFVYADAADGAGMADRWAQASAQFGGDIYVVLKVYPGYRNDPNQPASWHQYGPSVGYDDQAPYSATVSPGFWKVGESPRLERNLARFESDVQKLVDSGAFWLLVTTWNEWGEGTSVEPAVEFADAYIDVLCRKLPGPPGSGCDSTMPPTATPVPTTTTPTPIPVPTPTDTPTPTPTLTPVPTPVPTVTPPPPSPGTARVLVGAGDIADCGSSGDEATANLLDGIPGTVFTAGDNAYNDGTAGEFANCYDPTWGRHKARTRPAPGNHDYHSGGGAYFDYFGANAGPPGLGYYSYDLGDWHIISLNSNCGEVGGCQAGSAQEQWLRADLAGTTANCVAAYWHHPRFSSSDNHGDHPFMSDIWQALQDFQADVVIAGHDHIYERFGKQDANGNTDPNGIRSFVVGTGGRSHYGIGSPQPNSEVRNGDTFGVLKLTLRATSYDWEFVPVAGAAFSDSGTDSCH